MEYGEQFRGNPRYLKEITWTKMSGGRFEGLWNVVLPETAS
jgi:hypothetical protein